MSNKTTRKKQWSGGVLELKGLGDDEEATSTDHQDHGHGEHHTHQMMVDTGARDVFATAAEYRIFTNDAGDAMTSSESSESGEKSSPQEEEPQGFFASRSPSLFSQRDSFVFVHNDVKQVRGDLHSLFKAFISERVWRYNIFLRWVRNGTRSTFIRAAVIITSLLLFGVVLIFLQSSTMKQTPISVEMLNTTGITSFDNTSACAVYQDIVINHLQWDFSARNIDEMHDVRFANNPMEWCQSRGGTRQTFDLPFAGYTFFQWCNSSQPANLTEGFIINELNERTNSSSPGPDLDVDSFTTTLSALVASIGLLAILSYFALPSSRCKFPFEVLTSIVSVLPRGTMMVSYSHGDFTCFLARRIATMFPRGVCWLDVRSLLQGINLPRTISSAAASADIGFVMLSEKYLNSGNCCLELLSFEPRIKTLFDQYPDLYEFIPKGMSVHEFNRRRDQASHTSHTKAVQVNLNYIIPRKEKPHAHHAARYSSSNNNNIGHGFGNSQDGWEPAGPPSAKLVVYVVDFKTARCTMHQAHSFIMSDRRNAFARELMLRLHDLGHEVVILQHPDNHVDSEEALYPVTNLPTGIFKDREAMSALSGWKNSFLATSSLYKDALARELIRRLGPSGFLRHVLQVHHSTPMIDNTWEQLALYCTHSQRLLAWKTIALILLAVLVAAAGVTSIFLTLREDLMEEPGRFSHGLDFTVSAIYLLLFLVFASICFTGWTYSSPRGFFPLSIALHCLIVCKMLGLATEVNVYASPTGVPHRIIRELESIHKLSIINLSRKRPESQRGRFQDGEQHAAIPNFSIINLEDSAENLDIEAIHSIDPTAPVLYFAPNHTFEEIINAAGEKGSLVADAFIHAYQPEDESDTSIQRLKRLQLKKKDRELKLGTVAIQLLKVALGLDGGATTFLKQRNKESP